MSDVFDPDGSTAYPPAAPVNPPRRAFHRILLTVVGLVVVIVVAFVVLILWPNPTVPADQPNMTPVATGTNNDWLSFDDFVPGTAIATDSVDATTDEVDSHECTLAFLGRDATDTAIAFTAGHCRKEGFGDRPYFTRATDPDTHVELGEFTTSQTGAEPSKVVQTGKDDWADFAVIAVDPVLAEYVSPNARIAGVYRVTKVLDHHYLLNNNVTLCKFGFVSGETCGKVEVVTGTQVQADVYSAEGDSGSPAYVKLGNDEVAAVGILRGSPEGEDDYSEFTLIAPVLDATRTSLVCDPACETGQAN